MSLRRRRADKPEKVRDRLIELDNRLGVDAESGTHSIRPRFQHIFLDPRVRPGEGPVESVAIVNGRAVVTRRVPGESEPHVGKVPLSSEVLAQGASFDRLGETENGMPKWMHFQSTKREAVVVDALAAIELRRRKSLKAVAAVAWLAIGAGVSKDTQIAIDARATLTSISSEISPISSPGGFTITSTLD